MKLPKQLQPTKTLGMQPSKKAEVRPSDCSDGTLEIWFPDGTSTKIPNTTACCYSYPGGCSPCSGHTYDQFIGEHFYEKCGPNNVNKCLWQSEC